MIDDALRAAVTERMKFIAKHREKLIEAWVAETGLHPEASMLVQQDKDGELRIWVERQPDRCMTHREEVRRLKRKVDDYWMALTFIKNHGSDDVKVLKKLAEDYLEDD